MENKRWLDILMNKKKLDPDYEVTPIGQVPFYLVEGINAETSIDESLLVYDRTVFPADAGFCYQEMLEVLADLSDPYPVVVFRDWEHERQVYWEYHTSLEKASDKKEFSDWFDKKLSIYIDGNSRVCLETDDRGINYLEYPGKDMAHPPMLQGRVYNISFFELKKLFNVTGAHLFINNVRYGLRRHSTGETLRSKFRGYLGVALYKRAVDLSMSADLIETLREALDIDPEVIPYLEGHGKSGGPEADCGLLLPENFWFYHNGISIYSYEETLQTPADRIVLCPDKVSVINGAQTLTNFFLEVEAIEKRLEPLLMDTGIAVKTVMDPIIKTIYVKTAIIHGDNRFVRPITHGLNTQIPILEESLLADSELSESINDCLARHSTASGQIRILKDGEMWTGERGINILDFVKHWSTIHDRPGKSKNFGKRELEAALREIQAVLERDTDGENVKKMSQLFQIYQWWDGARDQRLKTHKDDAGALTIGKYGKNYFGSYVLHEIQGALGDDRVDDPSLTILYERFLNDLRSAKAPEAEPISLGDFKRDILSDALFSIQAARRREGSPADYPKEIETELQARLNQAGQSAYSFYRTIADYLIEHGIVEEYFRVISRTGKKCREAFPFPNSTFTEIVDMFDSEGLSEDTFEKAKERFSESVFAKAIERRFPVFVIDKDDEDHKNKVSGVHFIEGFSFAEFKEYAERAYEQTIEAFKLGEESRFPRSSQGLRFHIRPKAIDAGDTFQFTNGDHITKRTFWANKDTVEYLIGKALARDG